MGRKLRTIAKRCILVVFLVVLLRQIIVLMALLKEEDTEVQDRETNEYEEQLREPHDKMYQLLYSNGSRGANYGDQAGLREYIDEQDNLLLANNTQEKYISLRENHLSDGTNFNLSTYAQNKLHALQNKISKLIKEYNGQTENMQPPAGYVCKRYDMEGKREKIVIPNVWEELLQFDKETDIFVSTQMHEGKFSALERFLKHWDGGMSVALYVNMSTVHDLAGYVAKNFKIILEKKNVNLHLVAKQGEFYPINYLRNIALNYTTSSYVFLCDIDFTPNWDLHKYIQSMVRSLLKEPAVARALVIPAFEFSRRKHIKKFPESKVDLLRLWFRGNIHMFHPFFPFGQKRTRYDIWKNTTEPYKIKYMDLYEPYLVMRKTHIPAFDPRFLGRYKNKVAHRYEIAAMGTEFVVLPDAFLIHYPHYINWRVPYGKCSFKLYTKFKREIKSKYKKLKCKALCHALPVRHLK